MRVALVYNRPLTEGNEAALCSADVLEQVEGVRQALLELGQEPVLFPLSRAEAPRLPAALRSAGVECAFNLVETLDEDPRLQGHVTILYELAGVPYTGSDLLALSLTTDKYLAKKVLAAAGVPTPRFALYTGGAVPGGLHFPVIVKPRCEDGSVGIEQDSVAPGPAELAAVLARLLPRHPELLVEEYVAGRELNVALLGYPEPEALPVAEIEFCALAGCWPIVSYQAKWVEASPEYSATPRLFPTDAAALATRDVAIECFRLFGCRDYARVDLRLSPEGVAYVLEVNANPCLSPQAGFCAALEQAGIPYRDFVGRLLSFALQRGPR